MPRYKVIVYESTFAEFEVDAENEEEAKNNAIRMAESGKGAWEYMSDWKAGDVTKIES